MASSISFRFIDRHEDVKAAIDDLNQESLLAVDCEGDSLSRDGTLGLVQIKGQSSVPYIFDVQVLGNKVFDDGLKEILESENIIKLMFDCKSDSDALFHNHSVKLAGVYDLQLYEIMYRDVAMPREALRKIPRSKPWYTEVPKRLGFKHCLEHYVPYETSNIISKKVAATSLLIHPGQVKHDGDMWTQRPLPSYLQEYAAGDVIGLFCVYNHFGKRLTVVGETKRRLEIASRQFVNYFRDLPSRSHDKFENNNFLPLNIIPRTGENFVNTGGVKCEGCRKEFPMSSTLRRGNLQLCTVCSELKRINDKGCH